MRRVLGSLLLLAVPFAVHAGDDAEIRIEPPAPTARTPLTATISGLRGDGCPPQAPAVAASGGTVRISFTAPTGAYDPSLFERVLIPVIMSQEGAYGSRWVTDAIIENAGDEEVALFQTPLANWWNCGIPEGCFVSDVLPARFVGTFLPQWPTGVFVHVTRNSPVRFQVLARDLSRQSEALGTEIPVVRENDWRSGPIHLMNVPADPRFRVTLRVYLEGDVEAFSWVPIRIFRMNSETPVVDTTLSLDRSHNGQIPATNWVADLAPYYGIAPGEPLRIEIGVPATGHRFWAFASVTNNTTQHVTVISPQ